MPTCFSNFPALYEDVGTVQLNFQRGVGVVPDFPHRNRAAGSLYTFSFGKCSSSLDERYWLLLSLSFAHPPRMHCAVPSRDFFFLFFPPLLEASPQNPAAMLVPSSVHYWSVTSSGTPASLDGIMIAGAKGSIPYFHPFPANQLAWYRTRQAEPWRA